MATTEYELILMLDPQAGDEQRAKVAADAKSKIESAGELKHETEWGVRKMAFEIKQRTEADYRLLRFDGPNALLEDLDHSLKIADGVLRFRVFKVDPATPLTTPPDTAQVMKRDEDERGGRGGRGRRSRADERGGPRSGPRDGERESGAAAAAGGEQS